MHVGALNKILYGVCVCMGNNPLTKARGLPFHTDTQPCNNLH